MNDCVSQLICFFSSKPSDLLKDVSIIIPIDIQLPICAPVRLLKGGTDIWKSKGQKQSEIEKLCFNGPFNFLSERLPGVPAALGKSSSTHLLDQGSRLKISHKSTTR